MHKVVVLAGATAVGKTAVSGALAKRINAEIISCDSMQVYKGMDIGTSKPSPELRAEIPHHLIDILEPDAEYSAADFKERAVDLIPAIHSRDKTPLVVGGSGLYVRALVDGLFPDQGADWELRRLFYQEAMCHGTAALHKKLKTIDPETAAQVGVNDLRRIIRALEVYEHTKVPISKLREDTKGIYSQYEVQIFGLRRPREELYRRIDERVEEMFAAGLVGEVKSLAENNRLGLSASQALGYKEIIGHLNGEYSLEEAKELLKQNTRRFAKRQIGWFKRDERIRWIELARDEKPEAAAERILYAGEN